MVRAGHGAREGQEDTEGRAWGKQGGMPREGQEGTEGRVTADVQVGGNEHGMNDLTYLDRISNSSN